MGKMTMERDGSGARNTGPQGSGEQCILDYMLVLDRAKSISEAAARCGVGQSALSNALKHLETELGIRLYDRKAGCMTQAGSIYVRNAERILSVYERCKAELSLMKKGTFTLGIGRYLGNSVASGLTERIYQAFPDLGFSIELESRETLRRLLLEHRLDMYLAFEAGGPLPGCIVQSAQPVPLYLAGAARIFKDADRPDPDVFSGLTFLKLQNDTVLSETAQHWMKKQGLFPGRTSETNSLEMARLLLSQADAFTVLPGCALSGFSGFRFLPMKGAFISPVFVSRAGSPESQLREEIRILLPEVMNACSADRAEAEGRRP